MQQSWFLHKRNPLGLRPESESSHKRPFSASRSNSLHSLVHRVRIYSSKDTGARRRKPTSRTKQRTLEDSFKAMLDRSLLEEGNMRVRSPINRQEEKSGTLHRSLRQRVKDLKTELCLKEEEIATLKRDNKSESYAQDQGLKLEIANLRDQLEIANYKLSANQDTVISLENQLETAQQSANSTAGTIRDMEQRQMQLEEQVRVLTDTIKNKEIEAESRKNEMIKAHSSDLRSRNEAWDKAQGELTAQLYSTTKALKSAEKAVKKKEGKLQAQHTEIYRLKRELADLQRINSDLKGSEERLSAENLLIKERIHTLEALLQAQQRLREMLTTALSHEIAVVKKHLDEMNSEHLEEHFEQAILDSHIPKLAATVLKALTSEESGNVSAIKLAEILKQASNEEDFATDYEDTNTILDNPTLIAQMNPLFRHIKLRLQMSRMTISKLVLSLCPDGRAIEAEQLKRQLRKPPLALTDPQHQHMLVLICLKRPLTAATLNESVDEEWVGARRIAEVLQARLGEWETYTRENEDAFDQEIATVIAPVAEELKSQCESLDSESCGYVSALDFLKILTNLHIHFSDNMLQYLQLLFYSLDQELDRVPYLTFLNAYISENGPVLPRSIVLQQQTQAILQGLEGRKPSRVFAASVDGFITVAHFKAGLNALQMWDLPESTLNTLIEELQEEDSSYLSLRKLEALLGIPLTSSETD